MSENKICYATGATETFGNGLMEAILSGAAKIRGKAADRKFTEKFRLLLGFLIMTAGLYFGLFTTGAGEGLGFLALMASPFVMVADRD
jgi:hypothetical protein